MKCVFILLMAGCGCQRSAPDSALAQVPAAPDLTVSAQAPNAAAPTAAPVRLLTGVAPLEVTAGEETALTGGTAGAPVLGLPAAGTAPALKRSPELPSAPGLAPRHVVALIGDSLTDFHSGGGYVRVLRRLCPESVFDNYGIGGQMTNQMRRRFQHDVLGPDKPKYTAVVIFGGVNDLYSNITANRTNPRIQADLTQMYTWAQAAGLRTIAMTVAPWGGLRRYFSKERGENTVALNHWMQAQVGGLVEVALDTPPLLSCGNPNELCSEHLPPFNDGIHFGKAAHEILGRALQRAAFSPCR